MKIYFFVFVLSLLSTGAFGQQRFIQFVYVSDTHYGIERDFRSKVDVDASKVSMAMIGEINSLPSLALPEDGGVRSGENVKWVDYLINTGDITNRAEKGIQRSTRSWRQFRRDWSRLELHNRDGTSTPMFLLPGNHDISNAVGHPAIPRRKVDATVAAEIYNAMLKPDTLLTKHTYCRDEHLCNYSFDNSGVRFVFLDMWPDTRGRAWLETELWEMPEGGICLLFVHDQPNIEAKHLINPNGSKDINPIDGFENLTGDASSVTDSEDIPVEEHSQLDEFLGAHPAIKSYFHGNENYNEFYIWGETVAIPVFRVDSPMKGVVSSNDELRLSFQFVIIDTEQKLMTVREYLWNRRQGEAIWGEMVTVKL